VRTPKIKAGPFAKKEFIDFVAVWYGMSRDHGAELWRITLEFDRKAQPCSGGLFWSSTVGGGKNAAFVIVEDNSGKDFSKKSPETVARTPAVRYATSSSKKSSAITQTPSRRATKMPRTAKAQKATEEVVEEAEETAAEVEEADEARDYTVYADKAITASMQDFHDWLNEEVGDLSEMDTVRIVALAGTLRMEFQKSDFNQERRSERKAAREAAAAAEPETEAEADPEESETPAKPTRKAATPKATADKASATKTPASRRGAARKPAAAGAAAPY
jgi:hypothetical protein